MQGERLLPLSSLLSTLLRLPHACLLYMALAIGFGCSIAILRIILALDAQMEEVEEKEKEDEGIKQSYKTSESDILNKRWYDWVRGLTPKSSTKSRKSIFNLVLPPLTPHTHSLSLSPTHYTVVAVFTNEWGMQISGNQCA